MTAVGKPATPLELFRAALRPLHDRIEATVDLIREDVHASDYDHFLKRSYGFIARCEEILDLDGAPAGLGVRERLKRGALELDLRARGLDPHQVPRPAVIPNVASWPAALGYFYVLEGSTLGSQILLRHLGHRLGLEPACTNFLRGYGARTGVQWRGFLDVLTPALAESSHVRLITTNAADTFTLLERFHALE